MSFWSQESLIVPLTFGDHSAFAKLSKKQQQRLQNLQASLSAKGIHSATLEAYVGELVTQEMAVMLVMAVTAAQAAQVLVASAVVLAVAQAALADLLER